MENKEKPDPKFIAQQLRKPTGDFGKQMAQKMNQVNAPLYDLVLETMELTDGEAVLEIGFGNGKLFDKLFPKAKNLQVCGLDLSQEMVAEALKYNQQAISAGNLELHYGNSDALPFPDLSFDKVFCCNVVYFWEKPEKHLKEIWRVLKPGGRFYAGVRTKESMGKFPFTQFGFVSYEEGEWKSILQKNGFECTETQKKTDPATEFEEMPIQMESVCYVAAKVNG